MKKSKSGLTVSLLGILLCSIAFYYVYVQKANILPELALSKAFSTSGAQIIKSEAYFWGKIGAPYDSIEKLSDISDEFAKNMGIVRNNNFSKQVTSNDIAKKVEIKGITSDKKAVNINAQINNDESKEDARFISVSVVEDMTSDGLQDIKNRTLSVFKKYNINPKINFCITGDFSGKLSNDELNSMGGKIFKEAGAKKVEGMRDGDFISVSAYSPEIDYSISSGGKKVNLNLAIRYNAYENKTYIWLATPVITIEY